VNSLNIAFLPLIRTTFDVPLAEEMVRAARENLLSAGFHLLGPEQPITDLAGAQAAVRLLAAEPVDLALIFQATFADSSMVVQMAENLNAPILLWAVPEPWSGERLRLNALCGINLAGHALRLRGHGYDYAYAVPQDPHVLSQVRSLASAGALRRRLQSARLGVVGEHPPGMDTCHLDEPALNDLFGITIERIPLDEVFERARAVPDAPIGSIRAVLDGRLSNLAELDQAPLRGTLSVYTALKEIAAERRLDGLAVRCWPEFFTEMGCAACGAMSMLSDGLGMASPLPCSCEADINGTLTQLILQLLAGVPAFGTDIVGIDQEKDLAAFWHCGLAPFAMADPTAVLRGGIHSNRKVPLVMDFPLKPGRATVARLSQATGELRLVVGQGEMLPLSKPFSGTAGTFRFDCSASVFLKALMQEGLEHHVSLVYGDFERELLAFARLVGLPVLPLSSYR
jgi:L-fucose isomerase-like protein